jgi:hypothetical protein
LAALAGIPKRIGFEKSQGKIFLTDVVPFDWKMHDAERNMKLLEEAHAMTDNVVFHVIAGVHEPSILDDLTTFCEPKVLVLGYKRFGRGVEHWSEQTQVRINRWKHKLPNYISKLSLSFDNLAIEQLSVRRCFTQEGWDRFYMGDDFTFTMYADAVKREYAPTSRSSDRTEFGKMNTMEFFKTRFTS